VISGSVAFRAILVYDVSRWGRFPDTDEAAHYEFLCKSSGIPVHYCAEPFPNDLSPISLILKTLKRTMASGYSRELGMRTLAGKINLVKPTNEKNRHVRCPSPSKDASYSINEAGYSVMTISRDVSIIPSLCIITNCPYPADHAAWT